MSNIYSKYLSINESKSFERKTKAKAIKEYRNNPSGYSEFSDKDIEKYEKQLKEIAYKLEKAGISVKKVYGVSVEEYQDGSDEHFTEEIFGTIALSSPIKDYQYDIVCDIIETYADKRIYSVSDMVNVGTERIHIIFDVVDRFWDEEDELEESSKRISFKEYKKIRK